MPATDDTRRQLLEIPQLAWWLPRAAIARTTDTNSGGGGKPGSRPPVRLDTLDILDARLRLDRLTNPDWWCDPDSVGVLPYLYGWARTLAFDLVDAGHPGTIPAHPTIPNLCRWLRHHLDWAAGTSHWPGLSIGIGWTWSRVEVATRTVRDDAPRHLVTHGEDCGRGFLHPLSDREWRCDACQKYIRIRAVTLPEAAETASCTPRALQKWVKAEPTRFARVEYQGIRYFDLGQLLARAAEAKLTATLTTNSS